MTAVRRGRPAGGRQLGPGRSGSPGEVTARRPPADGLRLLTVGPAELQLAQDCSVVSRRAHDEAVPALVAPAPSPSGISFCDVAPHSSWSGPTARTVLTGACGRIDVRDALVSAAEAVGRAAPGIALVRLVRCLDGPLDVEHRTSIGPSSQALVRWRPLNRIAFGHLAGRKVTVDGGELDVGDTQVTTRLRADVREWAALTVAVDGHLPADAEHCRRLLLDSPNHPRA